ncbi:MAG: hypothetical protein JW950_03010 [Deltaproteobacteria bacterium]|nr:hypothetical protein [Deltaproteobacteria bacterium]
MIGLLLLILSGCGTMNGVQTTVMPDGETVLRRIAVVPFEVFKADDESVKVIRCPLCGSINRIETPAKGSEKKVEKLFYAKLGERKRFELIPPERVSGIYQRIAADSLKKPLLEILVSTGRELESDGIVMGYLYRYRERKGFPYSVKQPASVAFEIHLIRTSDGALVWKGAFDKTQTALMENLLQVNSFYRMHGQWVTAEVLAEEGIDQILETFPGFK